MRLPSTVDVERERMRKREATNKGQFFPLFLDVLNRLVDEVSPLVLLMQL